MEWNSEVIQRKYLNSVVPVGEEFLKINRVDSDDGGFCVVSGVEVLTGAQKTLRVNTEQRKHAFNLPYPIIQAGWYEAGKNWALLTRKMIRSYTVGLNGHSWNCALLRAGTWNAAAVEVANLKKPLEGVLPIREGHPFHFKWAIFRNTLYYLQKECGVFSPDLKTLLVNNEELVPLITKLIGNQCQVSN